MNIGFIGAGNMAQAILSGLVKNERHQLMAFDIDESKRKIIQELGVSFLSLDELLEYSEVVVLAIKPYQYKTFMTEQQEKLSSKLVVSIAAGITDHFMKTLLKHNRFVRVMPNTPALVNSGITGICENETLIPTDKMIIEEIFESVGSVNYVSNESFDAIIPVTGSSPAYSFMFINELIQIGVREGIEYQTAKELACEAVIGAAKLFMTQDEEADVLVDRVCSKGGTTIEGVRSLKEDDFSAILAKALDKCLKRAKEMSIENDNTL